MKNSLLKESPLKRTVRRYKAVKAKKDYLNDIFELIAKYVFFRKQGFNRNADATMKYTLNSVDLLPTDVSSSAAPNALHIASSAILGAMWVPAGISFRLIPAEKLSEEVKDDPQVKNYFERITRRANGALNRTASAWFTSCDEVVKDALSFGTGLLGIFQGDPTRYEAFDLRNSYISEGKDGKIDCVYRVRIYTVREMEEEFGDKASPATREKYGTEQEDHEVIVLESFEKRPQSEKRGKEGKLSMPYSHKFIELEPASSTGGTEKGSEHLIEEGGFSNMRVIAVRFWRVSGETYGRSPAMNVMPSILQLNRLEDAFTDGAEKKARPPLGVRDKCVAGRGKVDISAGGLTLLRESRHTPNSNQKPIEPLFVVGDMAGVDAKIERLQGDVSKAFFIDRLLDFTNKTRMTAEESRLRADLRGQSLNTVFGRFTAELFDPAIEASVDMMFGMKYLGYFANDPEVERQKALGFDPIIIPEVLRKVIEAGEDLYEIVYITPAVRLQRQEEMESIRRALEGQSLVAQVSPQATDNTDFDKVWRTINEISGAPDEFLRAKNEIDADRDKRAQAQAQAQQMQQALLQGQMAKDQGAAAASQASAVKDVTQSGIDLQSLIGGK